MNEKLEADTFFYFTSSPSAIGQGQTLMFTGFSTTVRYDLGVYSDSVTFEASGYRLAIVGPGLTLPTVGLYTNVTIWPDMGSGAGMRFTTPSRADNWLKGYFNVLQADYDSTGQVAAFAVDFMQYDQGRLDWWNQGSIRYNSSIAIPEPSAFALAISALMVLFGIRFRRG